MPDASIRIDGRQIAEQVRYGQANGVPVANLVVAAGRSKKNDQGGYDQLSNTVYDVAFWREHHDLIAGLGIGQGDTVIITGNVTGTDVYEGKAKVKVSGHGIQHFPKRDGGQGGGFGQPQQTYQPSPQGEQWNNAQQYGSGTGGGGQWPTAAQPGSGYQPAPQQQGFDQPPF